MSDPDTGSARSAEGVQENGAAARLSIVRVGEIATGRAGDKGNVLDLTLVARDDAAYALLSAALSAAAVRVALNRVVPGPVQRYEVPGLRALKYVAPEALTGGVYASLRPGLHWQKAAIWLLLDLEIDSATAIVQVPEVPQISVLP